MRYLLGAVTLAPFALLLLVLELMLSENKTPWLSLGRFLRREEEVKA